MTESPGPGPAPAPRRRPRRLVRGALGVIALIMVAVTVGAAWWLQPQPLLPEATDALASTDAVTFTQEGGYLQFTPAGRTPATGLILYPGGKVEPAAYARSARVIAAAGHLVAIVPMPLNLAVLGADGADAVIDDHPEIQGWAIGGHSLGGAMAGQYVAGHPGAIDALVLWAAYPNGDVSAIEGLRALSVYGSLDGGADRFGSPATRATLPADTTFLVIEGGNHEQMGDYTGQPNDPPATITRDGQQAEVQDATIALLDEVWAGG